MGSVRLRKADRVAMASKGNKAQYVWGTKKREGKLFGKGTIGSIAKVRGEK